MHNRAMVGHAETICQIVRPCCWICVPECSPPEAPTFQVGFGKPCWIHLGAKRRDPGNILGPDWGPSLAILAQLRHLEATALLLAAKLGDFEGKLGYREVMLRLSRAMLCQVEALCQVLFGHVVGFASRNALPQQDQDFQVGFCQPCWLHWGLKYGYLVAMLALLAPFWDQLPPYRGP